MSDQQVVQLLLKPGYSTAAGIGAHAGRGVGLDVVSEVSRQLGAQMRVLTRARRFTEFSVRFAA
jgi:chemotaxis protein histidine kinase CheA